MAKVATTVLIVILSYYLKASMGKDKNISSNQIIIPRFNCRSKSTAIQYVSVLILKYLGMIYL